MNYSAFLKSGCILFIEMIYYELNAYTGMLAYNVGEILAFGNSWQCICIALSHKEIKNCAPPKKIISIEVKAPAEIYPEFIHNCIYKMCIYLTWFHVYCTQNSLKVGGGVLG